MRTDLKEITELPKIWPREADSHKGDYGHVLIIAGSRGMTGAAGLAAAAALRSGAGLVHLAVPQSLYPIVAGPLSCHITEPLPETSAGTIAAKAIDALNPLLAKATVVAIGPGLSTNADTGRFVAGLMPKLHQPAIVDADGLNLLAREIDLLKRVAAPVTITPHPGEAARLLATTSADVQSDRVETAHRLHHFTGATVILKGHRTVVTDGQRLYVNPTGNPGMATAGSGDVLLGTIAAISGQGFGPFEAGQLAVYVHGLAGDIAADQIGEISVTARDILEALPAAFQKLAGRSAAKGSP